MATAVTAVAPATTGVTNTAITTRRTVRLNARHGDHRGGGALLGSAGVVTGGRGSVLPGAKTLPPSLKKICMSFRAGSAASPSP